MLMMKVFAMRSIEESNGGGLEENLLSYKTTPPASFTGAVNSLCLEAVRDIAKECMY